MSLKNSTLRSLLLAGMVLLFSAVVLFAQPNPQVNFQGILELNGEIAPNDNYDFVFKIYDAVTAGNMSWQETHTDVPVLGGIYSVNFSGTTLLTSLNFADNDYWLEIMVENEILAPRQKITYSMMSLYSMTSDIAPGSIDSTEIADDGIAKMDIDWGTTGNKVNAGDIPIQNASAHFTAVNVEGALEELHESAGTTYTEGNGIDISTGNIISVEAAASGGLSVGTGGVSLQNPWNNIPSTWYLGTNSGNRIISLINSSSNGSGDALYLCSNNSGVSNSTSVLYSVTLRGHSARFIKNEDDDQYAVNIEGSGSSSNDEALRVWGLAKGTQPWSVGLIDGNGNNNELYSILYKEKSIQLSGTSHLINGISAITFSISDSYLFGPDSSLKILLTPKNSWSGLYYESSSNKGFTVKSGAGDPNAEFDWLVIGVLAENKITEEDILTPEEIAKKQRFGLEH